MVITVAEAVDSLLEKLELDDEGHARAAIAHALAVRLDATASTGNGALAMAAAGLAKELSSTLDALMSAQVDPDAFIAGLFRQPAP